MQRETTKKFTSSGTFTCPPGVTHVDIEIKGGADSYYFYHVKLSPNTGYAVTVSGSTNNVVIGSITLFKVGTGGYVQFFWNE